MRTDLPPRASARTLVGVFALAAALVSAITTTLLDELPDYRLSGAILLGALALGFAVFAFVQPKSACFVCLGLAPLLNAYMFFTERSPDPRPGALKHFLWSGVVVGWFLRSIASGRWLSSEGRERRAADTVFLLYLAYAAAQATRALPFGSVGGFLATAQGVRQEFEFLLAYFVARDLFDDRRDLFSLARAMTVGTGIAAFVGLLQVFDVLPPPFGASTTAGVERVDSLVMEANNFAWTITLAAPIFVLLATRPAIRLPLRLAACLAFAAYGALVAASGSRTGFVIFFLGTTGVFLGRRRPALLLAFVPLAAVVLLAFPILSERFQEVTEVGGVDEGRLRMWRRLAVVAQANPLFGGGYGWVGGAVPGVSAAGTQWADSSVVHVTVQFGFVGMVLFFGGLVAAIASAIGSVRAVRDPEVRSLGGGFAGALLGCLLISPVHIPWLPFPTALYAWILLGTIVGLERFDGERVTVAATPSPAPSAPAPVRRGDG